MSQTDIDRLPEPARSVALQIVADLIDCGHPPDAAMAVAARQAAAFVAERAWDCPLSGAAVLNEIEQPVPVAAE